MIHYTLLPDEEIKTLEREYRTRFLIIALFFISCGVVLGLISLIPSFFLSYVQKNEVSQRAEQIRQSRKASGIDEIEKELVRSQAIAEQITTDEDGIAYSNSIQKIISHRSQQILLSSFEISHVLGTTTPYEAVMQGKALTREALLQFKKELESDTSFSKVDLPLSDLAKSKNINFTLKFTLNPPTKK